jgi:hypothetical protein
MGDLPKSMKTVNDLFVCPCGYHTSDVDQVDCHFSIKYKGYCHNGIGYFNDQFKCICEKSFDSFEDTEEHCILKKRRCMYNNEVIEQTRCKVCKLNFEFPCDLKTHQKTKTHKEKASGLYKDISLHCNLCNVSCLSRNLMESHLKTKKHIARLESPPIALECTLCNIKCLSQAQMKKHLETKKHTKNESTKSDIERM